MQQASIYHMFCDSSPFDIFATCSCLLWLFPIFAQLPYNRCFLRKSIAKKHKQNPMTHCAVVAGRKPCHENPVHAPAPDPLNLPNLELPSMPHLATPSWYFRFPIAEQWQMKGKKPARVVIWGTQGYMWQKTQEPKNQRRLLQIFAGKPDRPWGDLIAFFKRARALRFLRIFSWLWG